MDAAELLKVLSSTFESMVRKIVVEELNKVVEGQHAHLVLNDLLGEKLSTTVKHQLTEFLPQIVDGVREKIGESPDINDLVDRRLDDVLHDKVDAAISNMDGDALARRLWDNRKFGQRFETMFDDRFSEAFKAAINDSVSVTLSTS